MFAGGIADKLGNRYEAKWLVRQLLDVIGGRAGSVRFEGISANFAGFEFAICRNGVTEWHQTKINNPNGNWTLAALEREGVLSAFKKRLQASDDDLCVFVSQDPAKDIRSLSDKAKIALTAEEFRKVLGNGHTEKFDELRRVWAVDAIIAFSWLKRSVFTTESQPAIESAIDTFSDFYFLKASQSAFEILREFLETRINRQITTEIARNDLRTERKLVLKEWSFDPTLKERLMKETSSYLATYTPFGVGGSRIPRSEARQLIVHVENARPNVILLTGIAGAGKSGVIREFISQLSERSIPHLALRIDQHLNCSSPKELGKAVIERDESPVTTLKGTFPDQLSVLIVDQVDAVSEVSGRNGTVRHSVLSLVDDVRNFGSIVLVIACRTFDLENDQRLKALKDRHGVEHIDVQLLTWETDVKPLLASKSIEVDGFTEKQRELLRLPLNLAIFLEVFDGAAPPFASRNDLFARLLERKGRSIRSDRQVTWEAVAPLSQLAEWMSEQQRLDAPEDILLGFGGALDILSSEGLIVRSRGSINFFHESFFDYIYARTFAYRHQSLSSLLSTSEQHLFRRTQVRQILETLRQIDKPRYLQELQIVIAGTDIRYHIKVAVAQWLGSLSDPLDEERDIVVALDPKTGPLPPLIRYALLSSAGWFDKLLHAGWISTLLNGDNPERIDSVILWLSNIAGERPTGVAGLLNSWWREQPEKGKRLLNWFGFVRRKQPSDALIDLCCRVIYSNPHGLFEDSSSNQRDMLLHTWAVESPAGAAKVLKAYFDAWFEAHPNQHPFERDAFRNFDTHSPDELAKKAPEAFIEGSIEALIRSIDLIASKEHGGGYDYSFRSRPYSGHHSGADAFLDIFRSAMRQTASSNSTATENFLERILPKKHEVFTHIWLETIASNPMDLGHLFPIVLDSPYLFEAGWEGVEWKSFADAAKATIPFLQPHQIDRLKEIILRFNPELKFASTLLRRVREEGEQEPWHTRRSALDYINRSGHDQWCILEVIGINLLSGSLRERLRQLRHKFKENKVPEPHQLDSGWAQSPIKREQATHMTDAQWLKAIKRYDNDEVRRRGRSLLDGGVSQLARELQHLSKEQPSRFVKLLEKIPDEANQSYVRHLLWGLAESSDPDSDILHRAILNAHNRPNRPYGSEATRLIGKQPQLASCASIFAILIWYIEYGEANDEGDNDRSNAERDIITIEDLLNRAGRLHVRGMNGVRGWAAEVLGTVLWHNPKMNGSAWQLLERRAAEEPLLSVRCCLMKPTVPLFNEDRERCAALAERLSRPREESTSYLAAPLESAWIRLAFPSKRLRRILRSQSARCAKQLEGLLRKFRNRGDETKSWLPLLTNQGFHLLPFLLRSVPDTGKSLIYRLVVGGDETSRMIGAWYVFQQSFQDSQSSLAEALANDGVIYRRLLADMASRALTVDEYRFRAEKVLFGSFSDTDKQVRREAADAFRFIKPDEFIKYRELAYAYLNSKAFEDDSWAFFHALSEAVCKVDDIVIAATEKLISDIKSNGGSSGRHHMDLHQLQSIIKDEYTSSEDDPDLRSRILNLIDSMLQFELYGVDTIIQAHERQ